MAKTNNQETAKKKVSTKTPSSTYSYALDLQEDSYITTESGVALQVAGLANLSKVVTDTVVSVQRNELRFLVDTYYQSQDARMSTDNQIRAIMQGYDGEGAEIPSALQWIAANSRNQEKQIQKMLDSWTNANPVAMWAKSIQGIGPTISASLIAYFDIDNAKYAGNFWSYAGLNDNNNPWLGVEKSKALVKEAFAVIKERNQNSLVGLEKDTIINITKALVDVIEDFYDPSSFLAIATDINAGNLDGLSKLLKKGLPYKDILIFSKSNELSDIELAYILEYLAGDKDRVSQEILEYVSKETRRPSSKIKSLCVVDEKSGYITKTALEKQLSKPPYNIKLKTLCWKIGESFVKCSNKESSLYGKLYRERRDYENQLNEELKYADQAANILAAKNIGVKTEAYKWYSKGMLPPAHINQRAKRYSTKLFISHLFECMYADKHGVSAPSPYVIDYLGHVQYIAPEVPFSKFISYKENTK